MLLVGLTGGIASGKSEAARHFASLGVPVLDADELARELVAPGQPALAEIVALFGPQILLPDGSLNRAELGRLVFSEPGRRRELESLLHPRIRDELARRLPGLTTPYAIFMAPLLLESGMADLVDRILVIDAPLDLQRQRAHQRDGHDDTRIDQVLAAQLDREQRLAAADDVIRNDGDPAQLRQAVEVQHQHYLQLAANT